MSTEPKPFSATPEPDLAALLRASNIALLAALNCHQWGTIVSFDPTKQTATVQLAALRKVPEIVDGVPTYVPKQYPLLTDVPVFVASGGTGHLTFAITAGDVCLVLFNDRDFDAFWSTGTVAPPASVRMHDLSDGLALVGFRPLTKLIAGYYTGGAELLGNGAKLRLSNKVSLASTLTDLQTVLKKAKDAMTALNGKTGPSAATQITDFDNEIDKLSP